MGGFSFPGIMNGLGSTPQGFTGNNKAGVTPIEGVFYVDYAAATFSTYHSGAWVTIGGGSGPTNAWVQGGNSYGATGILGTLDNEPVSFIRNGVPFFETNNVDNSFAITVPVDQEFHIQSTNESYTYFDVDGGSFFWIYWDNDTHYGINLSDGTISAVGELDMSGDIVMNNSNIRNVSEIDMASIGVIRNVTNISSQIDGNISLNTTHLTHVNGISMIGDSATLDMADNQIINLSEITPDISTGSLTINGNMNLSGFNLDLAGGDVENCNIIVTAGIQSNSGTTLFLNGVDMQGHTLNMDGGSVTVANVISSNNVNTSNLLLGGTNTMSNLGHFTAGALTTNGYVPIDINGVTYNFLVHS